MPRSNRAFWQAKFLANLKRDRLVAGTLRKRGWRVLVVWECEIVKDTLCTAKGIRDRLRH